MNRTILSSALIDILSQTLSRGSDGADDALKNTMLGLAWFGLVWLGLAWFGLVWLGLAWLGLV